MLQEKVYREQMEIFSGSNRLPTAEDLHKMTYLEQCLKESLRLFSTVPLIHRRADTDIPLTSWSILPPEKYFFIVYHLEMIFLLNIQMVK